jgi:hypothetical protein
VAAGGRGVTVTMKVADIERAHCLLSEAGLRPTPIKDLWGTKVVHLHDPEGNRLEFLVRDSNRLKISASQYLQGLPRRFPRSFAGALPGGRWAGHDSTIVVPRPLLVAGIRKVY